jgi:hypothetical protein
MLRRRILLAVVLAVFALPAGAAEPMAESREVLRDTIRANKKALVEVNLGLTKEEAAKFWPVYERYQKDLGAVQDRLAKVIESYIASFPDLSDEKAATLVGEYLTLEEDRAKVRRAFLGEFESALPGRKVARFYQIENKMDAVLRYDLAARIPVVEK